MNKYSRKNLKKNDKFLSLFVFGSFLSACNSGSDSSGTTSSVVTTSLLSGAVIKGPLQGALVYADIDGDGIGDGTPIMTSSDGSYTIQASSANATIIAVTSENTIDTSSGETLSGITLKAPAGSSVVTPATTILEAQPDIEPAQLAVALGIPTTAADGSAIDLMSFNPYAADADPAAALASEKAAQQVMVTIKAVSAAAEGAGMNAVDAFENAMASVAEVVSFEAEKIDVSSTASIAAAEATMATTKVNFSDPAVLTAVTTAVQTKVVAAAAADETIEVDTTAFAAVLETAVTAVVNVNAAIEAITDTDLSSTETMGTFATLTDMASEIKAAAEAEVITPGSGAEIVTFTDNLKFESAAAEASLLVADKLIAAAEKFDEIYEEFLLEFPPTVVTDATGVVDLVQSGVVSGDDETTIIVDPVIKDPTNDQIDIVDDEVVSSDSGGGGYVFTGGGAPVDTTTTKFITSSLSSVTTDSTTIDFYVYLNVVRELMTEFKGLTGYKIDINTTNGWTSDTESMAGSTAFSWVSDVSLTDGSKTTGAISVNNLLSNSSPGTVVLVSGNDLSNGSDKVKLGSLTFDPVDSLSTFGLTISGSITDTSDLLVNQSSYSMTVY
jgi:hypothetical protein